MQAVTSGRFLGIVTALMLGIAGVTALAAQGPQTFTLDGYIKQAGTTTALKDAALKIKIQIMDPTKHCLLYEEEQTVDTVSSGGYFSILVGSDIGAAKRTVDDSGLAMYQVFQNSTAVVAKDVPGQTCTGGTFTPITQDYRYMRVTVTPSGTGVADVLSPDTVMDAVPAAVIAEWAESVGGFTPNDLLKVNAGDNLTQTNLENLFAGTGLSNLQAIAAGNFMPKSSTAGATLPSYATATPPTTPVAGSMWYDSGTKEVKYFDGSTTQIVGTGGGSVTEVKTTTNLTVDGVAGGTITSSGTLDLADSGVVASTFPKVTVDAKGRVTAGGALVETDIPNLTTAGKVSGDTITSGTIGGNTVINTTGNITTTGTITAPTFSSTAMSTRQLDIYDDDTNYARLTSPADLAANYILTLPADDGTSGQVLSTNGTGTLSWIDALTDVTGYVNGGNTFGADASIGLKDNFRLDIKTNDTARITVAAGGAVGIGTTDPNYNLDVAGDIRATGALRAGSAGTDGQIRLTSTSGTERLIITGYNAESQFATQNAIGYFTYVINGSEKMRLDSAGHLGVGAVDPKTMLEVAGTVKVGNGGETCAVDYAGGIRYNGGNLQFCNGTAWANLGIAGSGITALTGDVTASGSGSVTATIANNAVTSAKILDGTIATDDLAGDAVTFAKIQDMNTNRILGRSTTGAGDVEEISLGSGLTLSGGTLDVADATDDDALGDLSCSSNEVPKWNGSAWVCQAAASANTTGALVLRDGTGNFAANVITANGLSINNAGSLVNVASPIGANYSLTLPADDGDADQVLITDGAGVLTWADAQSGATAMNSSLTSFTFNSDADGAGSDGGFNFQSNGSNLVTVNNAGDMNITSTTTSSNWSNGALVVGGGMGVHGNINLIGNVNGLGIATNNYVPTGSVSQYPSSGPTINTINTTFLDGSYSQIRIGATNTSENKQYNYIVTSAQSGAGAYSPIMAFGRTTGASAYSESMRIDENGYLGIGTINPMALLDVNGTINIRGVKGIDFPSSDTTLGASIAIGPNALNSLSTTAGAYSDIAIGSNSLAAVTTGGGNIALGLNALSFGPNTGSNNIAIGSNAGVYMYNGASQNVAIGSGAMYGNSIDAGSNVAIGYNAIGNGTVGGSANVSVGASSGFSLSKSGAGTADYNTMLGDYAGHDITQGTGNIVIGAYSSPGGITTGNNNILIGRDVRAPSITANGQLNIGNLIYGTDLGTGVTASTGNVGIGKTDPSYKLDVVGDINVTGNFKVNGANIGGGAMPSNSSSSSFLFNSDSDSAGSDGGFSFQSNGSDLVTINNAGDVNITSTTVSGNPFTGALTVAGGIGSAGKISAGAGLLTYNSVNAAYTPTSTSKQWPYDGNSHASTVLARNTQSTDERGSFLTLGVNNSSVNPQYAYLGAISNAGVSTYTPTIVIGQQTGATAYAERMRIDEDGNVGIGTTDPSHTLDVVVHASATPAATFTSSWNNNATYPAISLIRDKGGATGAVTDFGTSLQFELLGNSGTMVTGQVASAWETDPVSNPTRNSYMKFSTAASSTLAERMRISSGGNVGIGTTAPAAALDVVGSSLLLGSSRQTSTLKSVDFLMPSYDTSKYDVAFMSFVAKSTTNTLNFGRGLTTGTLNGPTAITFNTSADVSHPVSTAEAMRIDSTGNVGIGTTAPSEKLEVNGSVKATSFISTSDRRLKKDIAPVQGLDAILQLNGVTWNWKNTGQPDMGVIAQDVEKVFPQAVVTDPKTGYKAVKYNGLIGSLIESTKDLYGMCSMEKAENMQQNRTIASLQEKTKRLADENAQLRNQLDAIKAYLCTKDKNAPICVSF